jgi:hypothetical protein
VLLYILTCLNPVNTDALPSSLRANMESRAMVFICICIYVFTEPGQFFFSLSLAQHIPSWTRPLNSGAKHAAMSLGGLAQHLSTCPLQPIDTTRSIHPQHVFAEHRSEATENPVNRGSAAMPVSAGTNKRASDAEETRVGEEEGDENELWEV